MLSNAATTTIQLPTRDTPAHSTAVGSEANPSTPLTDSQLDETDHVAAHVIANACVLRRDKRVSASNGISQHLLDAALRAHKQSLEHGKAAGASHGDVPHSNDDKGSVSTRVPRGQGSLTSVHSPRASSADALTRAAPGDAPSVGQAMQLVRLDGDDVSKKARLVWSDDLHHRFLQAVATIGLRQAVPKSIMQVMKLSGLTRENVASHLQKYRMYLKRKAGLPTSAAIEEHHWARLQAAQAEHLQSVFPSAEERRPPSPASGSAAQGVGGLHTGPFAGPAPQLARAAAPQAAPPMAAAQPAALPRSDAGARIGVPAWRGHHETPALGLAPAHATPGAAPAQALALASSGLPAGMLLPPPDTNGVAIGLPAPFRTCMHMMMALQAPRLATAGPPAAVKPEEGDQGASLPLPQDPSLLMPAGFKPEHVTSNLRSMREALEGAQPARRCPDHAAAAPSHTATPPASLPPGFAEQPQLMYVPCNLQALDGQRWALHSGGQGGALPPLVVYQAGQSAMPQMMFSVSMAAYQACHSLPAKHADAATPAEGSPCKADSSLSTAPASACKPEVSSQRRRRVKRSCSDADDCPPLTADHSPREPGLPRGQTRKRRPPAHLRDGEADDEEAPSPWNAPRRRPRRGSIGLGVLADAAAALQEAESGAVA